jgi:hypothetical protein
MVKSRLWHEVLDLAICWRFFKYKLVLKDTKAKLSREMTYLSLSETRDHSDWYLPVRLNNVLKRLNHIQRELESLESPLDEITQMALISRNPLANNRLTVSRRLKKHSSHLVLVITWSISL